MTNKTVLTARENETLALTWQCFMTEPKVTLISCCTVISKLTIAGGYGQTRETDWR